MKVLAYDNFERERPEYRRVVPLEDVFAQSDVLALHCPLTPRRRALSTRTPSRNEGRDHPAQKKPGPLIVEQDLADALNSGRVYARRLDVVSQEPIRGTTRCSWPGTASSRRTSPGRPGRAASV